jgi:hypothetical protein
LQGFEPIADPSAEDERGVDLHALRGPAEARLGGPEIDVVGGGFPRIGVEPKLGRRSRSAGEEDESDGQSHPWRLQFDLMRSLLRSRRRPCQSRGRL